MATIWVDGREYVAEPTDNLLHACLSSGIDIPYFCWHPALGSVGACRQCAVKQFHGAEDRTGRLVMACMTPAAEGTRISVTDRQATAFRASVIEWLMTNHPHDCPVCEEGGECHLQDMTLMTGHTRRRYRFRKRTFRNQYLGPFVSHEMNRCIACYRCVRFYGDYAGGRDLNVFGAHNHVYFGRAEDGVLESEFAGNLVEVCPTGVFTDRTLSAVYTRKWDLKGAASVCVHCGVGCNTIQNARSGELRRTLNRYNGEVNGYFICDRGRFGYGFTDSPARIRRSLVADAGSAEPISTDAALARVATLLRHDGAIGIGSPRASLEANFALRKLVGSQHFYVGVSDREAELLNLVVSILREGAAPVASLHQAEQSDAVLVLGENVSDTAPRLALALRQTVRHAAVAAGARQKVASWQDAPVRDLEHDHRSPLLIATPDATRLDDVATATYRAAPDDIARLGFAVAHAIDQDAPAVPNVSPMLRQQASRIAELLRRAERPLIVSGTGLGHAAVIRAAACLTQTLRARGQQARIVLAVPEPNSLGLTLIGGRPLSEALNALQAGTARTLIVLENDLFRRDEPARVKAALNAAADVVAIDYLLHETVHHARIVLATATFAETAGTLVSYEARAQRFFPVLLPGAEIEASWRWLNEIACLSGRTNVRWQSLDEVIAALAAELPELAAVGQAAPNTDFRIIGNRIGNAPHRYSGRTAAHADRTVIEPITQHNPDAPYSNSMEGYYGQMPDALYPYFWAPGWNSVQSLNKFQQEVGGPMRGADAGVRLIEPNEQGRLEWGMIPRPFKARRGEWLIVPEHRIFGSEQLSALAPAIAELVGAATLGLNPQDAKAIAVRPGTIVEVALEKERCLVPVQIRPALPRGVAVLAVGLPGTIAVRLPGWAKLRAIRAAEAEQ